ncbi:MAG: hypothetical protein ACOZQL_35045 [Myxococcota bacterium]
MKTGAAEGLLHPVALAAVGVLVLNDHWAKAQWPGVVTGKLSDVAGLVFFPLFLQAGVELVAAWRGRPWSPSRAVLVGAAVATALVFALVKTWAPATELYRVGLGLLRWPLDALIAIARAAPLPSTSRVMLVADATDLLALPAVALPVSLGWRRSSAH